MTRLSIRPVNAAGFSPYGWLADADGATGRPIDDGSSLRVDNVGELQLTADGVRPAWRCSVRSRAIRAGLGSNWNATVGTQSFVPMGGARHVVLVALGELRPGERTPAAFAVAGHQTVRLRAGTWHRGLIAPVGGDFVVIEGQAAAVDCELATLEPAVTLV